MKIILTYAVTCVATFYDACHCDYDSWTCYVCHRIFFVSASFYVSYHHFSFVLKIYETQPMCDCNFLSAASTSFLTSCDGCLNDYRHSAAYQHHKQDLPNTTVKKLMSLISLFWHQHNLRINIYCCVFCDYEMVCNRLSFASLLVSFSLLLHLQLFHDTFQDWNTSLHHIYSLHPDRILFQHWVSSFPHPHRSLVHRAQRTFSWRQLLVR